MKRGSILLCLAALANFMFGGAPDCAAESGEITYQGSIAIPGESAPDGSFGMRLSLWDAATDGNSKWTETHSGGDAAPIVNGVFSVEMGSLTPFPARFFAENPSLWLQIEVDIDQSSTFDGDEAYSPRVPFSAAPYAFVAGLGYENVAVVAKNGGDYDTITDALNSIADAGASNRYLVWVAPGDYEERVTMKPYVDIQGAGQGPTRITFTGSSTNDTGTIVGANYAELRDLAVENTGGDAYAIAIYNDATSPTISNVAVQSTGATHYNTGIWNENGACPLIEYCQITLPGAIPGSSHFNDGMFNGAGASPVIRNTQIDVTGDAYWNRGVMSETGCSISIFDSQIRVNGAHFRCNGVRTNKGYGYLRNVVIEASDGPNENYGWENSECGGEIENCSISARNGTSSAGIFNIDYGTGDYLVKINQSRIQGDTYSIINDYRFDTYVAGSQVSGGDAWNNGYIKAAGCWDENYTFYSDTLP